MLLLLLVLAVTVGFIVVVAVVVLRYNKQWVLPWSCMSFGGGLSQRVFLNTL